MPACRTKPWYYAVHKGRNDGVFNTWEECEEQVKGYPGAQYKKFSTREEAKAFAEFGPSSASKRTPSSSISPASKLARLEAIKSSLPPSSPRLDSQSFTPSNQSSSKPTRLELIQEALSQSPASSESQPSTQRIVDEPRSTPASSSRFKQIYLALTTSDSTDTFDYCSASSQSSIGSSLSASSLSTPSTSQITPSSPVSQARAPNQFLAIQKPSESNKLLAPVPTPPKSSPQFSDDGPLSQYFSKYFPSFTPDLSNPATSEYQRMKTTKHALPFDGKQTQDAFKDALSQQFNTIFGKDVNSLDSWQALCARIGISPIPQTLEDCREVVMDAHVNLVDLVTPSGAVEIFRSVEDLSAYTCRTKKFFPRDNVHAGDPLNYLLRHIFNPGLDADRSARNRRYQREAVGGRRGIGRSRHGISPY